MNISDMHSSAKTGISWVRRAAFRISGPTSDVAINDAKKAHINLMPSMPVRVSRRGSSGEMASIAVRVQSVTFPQGPRSESGSERTALTIWFSASGQILK